MMKEIILKFETEKDINYFISSDVTRNEVSHVFNRILNDIENGDIKVK